MYFTLLFGPWCILVRDWATFALGSSEDDTPEIREALRRRLDDSFEEARCEAIWALARRKDPKGLRMLIERLESESWWQGDEFEAEEILGLKGEVPVDDLCDGLKKLLKSG